MAQMSEIAKDIERRVQAMAPEQREHLQMLVYEIVKCYDEDTPDRAIVLLGNGEGLESVVTVNTTTMEAANMLLASNDMFEFLNTRDAPPKEKFN